MDNTLPTEFDLIVVGTGLIESIIAAAASRVGKKVLHIDSNDYYGGLWSSFNFDSFNKVISQESSVDNLTTVNEGEQLLSCGNGLYSIKVHGQEWHVKSENSKIETPSSEDDAEESEVKETVVETWTKQKLLGLSRKFNIDLVPKLHFARGDFVELLISSNIARYSEFRSVSRILTYLKGRLEAVPCSRSDVFTNTKVSVVEKRMLMKLLTTCLDKDESEFAEYKDKTFRSYLKSCKLTDDLLHFVLYAIGMGTDDTPCLEGITNIKRFMNSLGRFGKTPFLYSMYGSGEIPQAFCRLSAVFGSVYALNQTIGGLILNTDNKFDRLITGEQQISGENIVLGLQHLPEKFASYKCEKYISRAIFITDKSILKSEEAHLTLLMFPPTVAKNACTIIEMGSLTATCPKDLYLVQMFARQQTDPTKDFEHCVNCLFNSSNEVDRANVLWSFYFTIPDTSEFEGGRVASSNIFVCPGPDVDLDYDTSVKKAATIFRDIYPDLEFLPRAPDPEEIIIEGDEGDDANNVTTEVIDEIQKTVIKE